MTHSLYKLNNFVYKFFLVFYQLLIVTKFYGFGSFSMNDLLIEYIPIVVFIGVALVIGLALMISPFILAFKSPDGEKLSAYECGFKAFDDSRMKFDVRFYLVSILFIIFDLEVAFCIPLVSCFR